MQIYNTLNRRKEKFIPIKNNTIKMYGCGVTPYKPSHLGHAMQAIIFDIIRRYFEYKGNKVTYVRNYTDIDDKIINAAQEIGIPPLQHSKNIINRCNKDFKILKTRKANYEPKVSDTIPYIIKFIQNLIEEGFAYQTIKGNVYYSVKKCKTYGKLSNQNIKELKHGTRKEINDDKQDALDFALWKACQDEGFSWKSPFGLGRPGWHIECSAMSKKFLGEHFDIHGGGGDLVFPHHENEIAQSEAVNSGKFANYWIHNGLLMVGKEKMSKSLNNDVSIEDWLKIYHPDVIRYLIITNHYRSHIQFVPERYMEANQKVYQIYKTLERAECALKNNKKMNVLLYNKQVKEFEASMDNDFNTVLVIAQIHKAIKNINSILDRKDADLKEVNAYVCFIRTIGAVLGIFDLNPGTVINQIKKLELSKNKLNTKQILNLIKKRNIYKQTRNYAEADEIRKKLESVNIILCDNKNGTTWDLKL